MTMATCGEKTKENGQRQGHSTVAAIAEGNEWTEGTKDVAEKWQCFTPHEHENLCPVKGTVYLGEKLSVFYPFIGV
jgi:hypothetical protein